VRKSKLYDLHPEARTEIEGADCWYSDRSPDAADEFVISVYNGIELICQGATSLAKILA
jgi:hypothetical protein